MADAADACAKAIIAHCQSPKLVPRLCAVMVKDRSAKLRQFCCHYLVQARPRLCPPFQ